MKINVRDINGELKDYDVILTYHSDEYNKDYIVYTDNNYNENDELQIYISEYSKDSAEVTVTDFSNNEEYAKIKKEIDNILLTVKIEKEKLNSQE